MGHLNLQVTLISENMYMPTVRSKAIGDNVFFRFILTSIYKLPPNNFKFYTYVGM